MSLSLKFKATLILVLTYGSMAQPQGLCKNLFENYIAGKKFEVVEGDRPFEFRYGISRFLGISSETSFLFFSLKETQKLEPLLTYLKEEGETYSLVYNKTKDKGFIFSENGQGHREMATLLSDHLGSSVKVLGGTRYKFRPGKPEGSLASGYGVAKVREWNNSVYFKLLKGKDQELDILQFDPYWVSDNSTYKIPQPLERTKYIENHKSQPWVNEAVPMDVSTQGKLERGLARSGYRNTSSRSVTSFAKNFKLGIGKGEAVLWVQVKPEEGILELTFSIGKLGLRKKATAEILARIKQSVIREFEGLDSSFFNGLTVNYIEAPANQQKEDRAFIRIWMGEKTVVSSVKEYILQSENHIIDSI